MPEFDCPHCDHPITASADKIGDEIKCPFCLRAAVVPDSLDRDASHDDRRTHREVDDADYYRPRRFSDLAQPWFAIGLVTEAIMFLFLLLFPFLLGTRMRGSFGCCLSRG